MPWKLENDKAPDIHLLSREEIELCNVLHIKPKPYLAIKEHLLKEAMKQGGSLKKKDLKTLCKVSDWLFLPPNEAQTKDVSTPQIDAAKSGRLYDFMIHSGWISKA
jgi:transcriptional adapter 2-alpha